MSRENVELAREAYEKLSSSGRLDAALEFLAPEVELHMSGAFPDLDPVYRGYEGVRKLADHVSKPWEQFTLEPDRFIDLGEQVLVLSHINARGRDGLEVQLPFAHLWTVRDGLVVRMDAFSGHEEALEAVGLSGQDTQADS
jgi:uncharacterized protein